MTPSDSLVGDYHGDDKRALFVEIAFRARKTDLGAIASFTTALKEFVPSERMPAPAEGEYRFLDSSHIRLRDSATTVRPPDAIATLAQTTVAHRPSEDFAQIGESNSPPGLANSFCFMFDRFLALSKVGEEAQIKLVFEIPVAFDSTGAAIEFPGHSVKLPEYKRPDRGGSSSIIWRLSGWDLTKKEKKE